MKFFKNNMTRAIVINLVILICMLIFTDMVYETNDDFALATRIVDGDPYLRFVNWFLCVAMIGLQQIIGNINAFVLVQVVASFACFTLVTKLMLDIDRPRLFNILTVFVLAVFAVDHYGTLQYTKTAALLVIGGMLALTDAMINKRGAGYYIFAFLFIYIGACFRVYGVVAAIGFAGLFLIWWVINNRKKLLPEGYLTAKRLGLYVVLLCLIAGTFGLHWASLVKTDSTDALKEYNVYNNLRGDVVDYPVYAKYEKNAEAYEAAGISKNDLFLIDHWYLDYGGAASEQNLRTILDIHNSSREVDRDSVTYTVKRFVKGVTGDVRNMNAGGIHICLMIILAVLGLCFIRPRYWWYIFAVGIAVVLMYMMLYHTGRPLYRATYVADVGAVMWLLYFFRNETFREKGTVLRDFAIVIAVMIIAAMQIPLAQENLSHSASVQNKIISQELLEYVNEHEDIFFVCAKGIRRSPPEYAEPMKAPKALPNMLGAGGWGTKSLYVLRKLEAYGLDNMFGDAIDNDNVLFIENRHISELTEYFNRWYARPEERILLEEVAVIDGNHLWRVVNTNNL